MLLPGLYVRVEIEPARAEGGFMVPQQAVTRQTSGDTLRVVDGGGNAEGEDGHRHTTVTGTAGMNSRRNRLVIQVRRSVVLASSALAFANPPTKEKTGMTWAAHVSQPG